MAREFPYVRFYGIDIGMQCDLDNIDVWRLRTISSPDRNATSA